MVFLDYGYSVLFLANVLDEPHGYLARSVLLGARSVTSNRVGSSALFGSVGLLFIELAKRFIRYGLNSFGLMEIIISG